MEARIQYVASADGTQIAYTTYGEGSPVVVAANAWGDINLHPLMRGLVGGLNAGGRQVFMYDGRGSGASDRNVGDMSLAARLADLEAVVGRLGLDRFDLVGTLHGCSTSIAYAAKHPDHVTRMVLIGAYSNGRDYYSGTPMLQAIRALAGLAEENWEFFTLTLSSWVVRFQSPEMAHEIAAIYRKGMEPRDYLTLMAACEATDVTDLLPKVSAPTLVIRDASSLFSTVPEFTRRVAAAIPNAQAVTITEPFAMRELLLDFMGLDQPTVSASDSPAFRAVLFSDLVGHTEMMRRLGDEKGRAVLQEHEALTRDAIKAHGGSEVKTMGDGFMASFPSVTRGVECALALQAAFAERNATAGEPLHIRVGLNAGEPIEEDGDLFGETVILASRIAGMASGGQVLASMAVRELCAGKGFLFADMGDHVMRGFEDPVRVFEVKRAG